MTGAEDRHNNISKGGQDLQQELLQPRKASLHLPSSAHAGGHGASSSTCNKHCDSERSGLHG
jgi:hypothetical protein